MRAAMWAEWVKSRRALPPLAVSIALTIGVVMIATGMLLSGGRGNPVIDSQLAPFVTGVAWVDLCSIVGVITAAGGLLGAGVLLSWMFGREFTDGALPRLFASSTARDRVAAAKLVLFLGWAVGISAVVPGLTLLVGLAVGYGPPDVVATRSLLKLAGVSLLTSLLAMPCAWVATIGRGVLAPIGTAVGLIVSAQLSVFAGLGAWVPFAAPGVWAGLSTGAGGMQVTLWQLFAVVPTAAVFAWLTIREWRRLYL